LTRNESSVPPAWVSQQSPVPKKHIKTPHPALCCNQPLPLIWEMRATSPLPHSCPGSKPPALAQVAGTLPGNRGRRGKEEAVTEVLGSLSSIRC